MTNRLDSQGIVTLHDIERHEPDRVVCACGKTFPTAAAHEVHFQIERARAALRGKENRGA